MTDDSITLKVESPVPGPNDDWFMLHMPKNLKNIEANFAAIRWHIDFRRRCMNQGFDNLLELLNKTEKEMIADRDAKKQEPPHAD